MNTPKWAQELTVNALIYLEQQGHKVNVPEVIIRHGKGYYSSGHCQDKKRIVLTKGKSLTDAKLVLLHEIAHLVTENKLVYWNIERAKKQGWMFPNGEPDKPIVSKRMYHTPEFWDTAWLLYRWAKLPIRYCQQREYAYKKQAQVAYRRNIKRQNTL